MKKERFMKNVKNIFAAAAVCVALFSCATSKDVYKPVDDAVYKDDFATASKQLAAGQEAKKPVYDEKNAVSLYLDKGLIEHYAGNYADSVQSLGEADRMIQEAFTKSVTKDIGSYIANDNTHDYAGEDYENIYTNIFNSLNYYYKGDVEGAGVEVRKVSEKLQVLGDKYTKDGPSAADMVAYVLAAASKLGLGAFDLQLPDTKGSVDMKNSALARYLSALVYRGEGRDDDARIDLVALNSAFAAAPKVYDNPLPASLKTSGSPGDEAAEELNIPKEKARLNVIAFTGLAPVKKQEIQDMNLMFYPVIGSLLPIDQKSNFKTRITLGNLALPTLEVRPSNISAVEATINGQTVKLDLLEDMGKVMENTFLARYNQVFVKTYIRAAIKYASVEVAGNVAQKKGLPQLAIQAAVLGAKKGMDASEQADIRSSRYFPDKAYVGGITLDPGTYTVTVKFSNGETKEFENVVVKAGALNLVEAVNLK